MREECRLIYAAAMGATSGLLPVDSPRGRRITRGWRRRVLEVTLGAAMQWLLANSGRALSAAFGRRLSTGGGLSRAVSELCDRTSPGKGIPSTLGSQGIQVTESIAGHGGTKCMRSIYDNRLRQP